MSEKRRNVAILAVVLLLAAASAGVVVARGFTLGLDLRGGLELVLKAQPKKGQTVTSSILGDAANIMRDRIDPNGTLQPSIRTSTADDTIEIQVPGVKNPNAVASLVVSGGLQSFELYKWLEPISGSSSQYTITTHDSAFTLLRAARKAHIRAGTEPVAWGLFDTATKSFYKHSQVLLPQQSQVRAQLGLGASAPLPPGTQWLPVPQGTIAISCIQAVVQSCPGVGSNVHKGTYWYLFKQPPAGQIIGPNDVSGASSTTDQSGAPIVALNYTNGGAEKFYKMTQSLVGEWDLMPSSLRSTPAFSSGLPQVIAVGGELVSAPVTDQVINATLTNSSEISNISKSQADRVALEIQSGTLPVTFSTQSELVVSATLGKSSLHDALVAGIAGLAFVLVFLVLFYGFLGLIADLALIVYGLLLAAIVVLLPVTMTLPGIAGTILTIGVAADANIVIFERIKEEVRAGKSMRAAISTGYRRGWHTIIDANVVTLITAVILYVSTTADVKGFALMLLIGVVTSIFTAVVATRAMLGVLAGFSFMRHPRVLGAVGTGDRWKRFDFIGRKRWWFAFSGIILVSGAISLGVQGLNQGIDFTGGSQISYQTAKAASQGQMQSTVQAILGGTPLVQGQVKAGQAQGSTYTRWQIQAHYLTGKSQTRLLTALKTDYGASSINLSNVSSSFGRSVLDQAILAIIFSLIVISLYVTYRFEWRFAVPVLVALFHDVLITIGVYSLVGRQVTADTVAAVLTVLGYSLYDTVIVFDRVRENIPILRRHTASSLVNESLAETITRSLNTSLVTLIPVVLMFIFGSGTLTDFAFALIVGIASGAYSSIFIAAPLLAMLLERDPSFATRRSDLERSATPAPSAQPVIAGGAAALPAPMGTPTAPRPTRRRRRGHGRAR